MKNVGVKVLITNRIIWNSKKNKQAIIKTSNQCGGGGGNKSDWQNRLSTMGGL